MQREDSWWGDVREKKDVREEGQRTVIQGISRRDWQRWQKADLVAITGAGCGLVAQGFTFSTGRLVSLC